MARHERIFPKLTTLIIFVQPLLMIVLPVGAIHDLCYIVITLYALKALIHFEIRLRDLVQLQDSLCVIERGNSLIGFIYKRGLPVLRRF